MTSSKMQKTQHGSTFLTLVCRYRFPILRSLTKTASVFELVSAYGGVGMSLGVPYVSTSTSFLIRSSERGKKIELGEL